MNKYFNATTLLNHLDFSGMNFDARQVQMLCETLCCCPNLMSVHLNDNGIMNKNSKGLFKLTRKSSSFAWHTKVPFHLPSA